MVDVPAEVLVVEAWPVTDSGLAPAPSRFRRLPGGLRHHQGHGAAWPAQVELRLTADRLEVPGIGAWPLTEVAATLAHAGPPISFVLTVPGSSQLLAMAASTDGRRLLSALA